MTHEDLKNNPPHGFWTTQPVNEVQLLTDLRAIVLERNAKRLPKWKFRLADDLVMQLQPQAQRMLFRGEVVQGRDFPSDVFKKRVRGFKRFQFGLRTDSHGPAWLFRPTCGLPTTESPAAEIELRDRTLEGLRQLDQLDASKMFQPACLICGKKLTDPVSMARWVGPECAHTTSLTVGTWRVPVENAA